MRSSITVARHKHQQQINSTPSPCVVENNTSCQVHANLEMGGEETDLPSLPTQGELQQRGVSKRQKEST